MPLLDEVEWQVLGTDIFLPPLAKACPLEWLATLLRDTPPPSLTSAAGVVILVPTPRVQRRWRQSHYNLALQKIVSSHYTVTLAEEGGGCCLMVDGPAGAGKTTHCEARRGGARVLNCGCVSRSRTTHHTRARGTEQEVSPNFH